jgi:hypothetical protein
MPQNTNPVRKSGTRNIFCPYYDGCLDYSAKRNWQFWDCSQCVHRLIQKPILEDHILVKDASPCYELPSSITLHRN